jgi:uncharacterized HAD superfamily protein
VKMSQRTEDQSSSLSILRLNLIDCLYKSYFNLMLLLFDRKSEYVFVDIDNTVSIQAARLQKFKDRGRIDYRKANKFRNLIHDMPLERANEFTRTLSRRRSLVWFTSRSIKTLFATYVWLFKNHFPLCRIVFTGNSTRKIEFLRKFTKKHQLDFIIDDMRHGYEFGIPRLYSHYKSFLENKNITHFESLPFDWYCHG